MQMLDEYAETQSRDDFRSIKIHTLVRVVDENCLLKVESGKVDACDILEKG